jgi:hypothetical protein
LSLRDFSLLAWLPAEKSWQSQSGYKSEIATACKQEARQGRLRNDKRKCED